MKTPHKHAEVIKAWADGAEIQYLNDKLRDWEPAKAPGWFEDYHYRIKPEPEPDRIEFAWAIIEGNATAISWQMHGDAKRNLKLTFDGDTGKLKAAEVV